MKNRIDFLGYLVMISLAFANVNSMTFRADAYPEICPSTVAIGVPFSIDIYINNPDSGRSVFSMPLEFTGTDISSVIHYNVGGQGTFHSMEFVNGFYDNSWFDLFKTIYEESWDGSLPDLVNITGIGQACTGYPYGVGEKLYIRFHFLINQEGTFCVNQGDMSDDVYDWIFEDPVPYFGGPYCFFVGTVNTPYCLTSTTDPVFKVCPGGDEPFRVFLKGCNGQPIVGESSVSIQFSNCSDISACSGSPAFTTIYPVAPSDQNGMVTFYMKGGDCPNACYATVNASCGTIATVPVKSFDINGDFIVSIANDYDFSLCNDYNNNGTIDFNDQNLFGAHIGHKCQIDPCDLFGYDFRLLPEANLDSGDVVTLRLILSNNNQAQACSTGFIGFYYSDYGTGGMDHFIQSYPYNHRLVPGELDTVSIQYVIPGYGSHCLKAKFNSDCCDSLITLSDCVNIIQQCNPNASVCYNFNIRLNSPAFGWNRFPYLLPNWQMNDIHIPSFPTGGPDSIVYQICTPSQSHAGDSSSVTVYVCNDAQCNEFREIVNRVVFSSNSGDVNRNCIINALDITYLINYLYKHGPAPVPLMMGDTKCDGLVNLLDITYLINYLYKGGKPPVCPW